MIKMAKQQAKNENEKKPDRSYKIGYIEEGIVIDHLPPKSALKIVKVLGLKNTSSGLVMIGMNLETKKHPSGRKDLIKIEKKSLTEEELNKIALISSDAIVNIIKNSKIVKKLNVRIPDLIEGAIKCGNPNCITNLTPGLSKFSKDGKMLKCHYCEKSFELSEINIF